MRRVSQNIRNCADIVENIQKYIEYLKVSVFFRIQVSSRVCLLGCKAPVGLQGLGTLALGAPVQAGCWCQKQ